MSLLDRTNSISKESPSSLLPPAPKRSLFGRKAEELLPKQGPASLLPESPAERYPGQVAEETVAVSPSSLLPPPPEPVLSRRMIIGGSALLAIVALILFILAFRGGEKPTPQLMQEAIAFLNEGKHDAAAIQLKNVLAREPDNLDANLLIGKAYLGAGALLDAEKALIRARELGAPVGEVTPLLVQALIDLDRHEDALKELNDATTLKLSSAGNALLRGRAFLGLGNLVEAKTQFTVARVEMPAEAMMGLARVMMVEGDPDGARKLIDQIVTEHPSAVSGWIVKGDLLRSLGENAEALAAYRQAQSLRSDNLEAILGAAVILIEQDDFGEAHKELRKARSVSPSSHQLGFAKALLAFREKRYSECREALQAVLDAAPRHMASVLLAGVLGLATGDIEQAHDAFVFYLTRFPGHVQARKMHAVTLLRKHQPQAAVESLSPFVDRDIRDAEFFAVAGHANLQIGDVKRARLLFGKAAALDPKNVHTLIDLGIASLSDGAVDAGIAELEKAVALQPKDPRPDRHLALALLARNRVDEALAVAERLEKRLPAVPEPHWIRGLVLSAQNDPSKARASFERALKANPAFFPAAAALAELDRQEGKQSLSRARFEAVLKHNPRTVEAALALAQMDAQEGKLKEGVARAQRTAADHPESAQAQMTLARLQAQAGNLDDAVGAARRAREVNARDPNAAELLGQIQLAAGDAAGAALSFTALVNMRPRYLPGRIGLARAQNVAGDRRMAIATARDALAMAPGNVDAFSLLGSLLLEEKRYDEALRVAAHGRERHPKLALGYLLEGEVRLAQANPAQALAAFRRADELQPGGLLRVRIHQAESTLLKRDAPVEPLLDWIRKSPDDVDVQIYCADALVRLGRIPEAMPLYQAVLKKAPDNFRLLNNIADALMRRGDPRALDYAQQAFQLRPDDPIIAATLGSVLLRSGKLHEAVPILQQAVQLAPENAEIRYEFVVALAKAGDRVRARTELKALLASGKVFPQIAEAQTLVEQL